LERLLSRLRVNVAEVPRIFVLAGVNGAGKSSIGGAMLQASGAKYFNPDEAARRIRTEIPSMDETEANAAAWREGRRLLETAITERLNFAFETTLGGKTMTRLLEQALDQGFEVRVWYVGLADVELHIARVRSRVVKGGHNIADEKIRERYDTSRLNLIRLLPRLTELRVYDNSREVDTVAGNAPELLLILHMEQGRIVSFCDPASTPEWAKAIFATAARLSGW
jgi:predicted ABC-type ATPase